MTGLGRCTICDGQVATNATACPHCGARFTTKAASTIGLIGSVGSALFWGSLLLLAGMVVVGIALH